MSVDPTELLNSGEPPMQDFIVLAGKKSPGLAYPVNAGAPVTWDKQKGWGFSGATLIYTGDDLSDFDVLVTLWERSHWREWNDFALLLEKPSVGARATAKSIQHPLLNRSPIKITDVVVRNTTQFEQSSTGLWVARIAFTAYRAPKPALGRPKGSDIIPGVEPPKHYYDAQIDGLKAKQAALGGSLGVDDIAIGPPPPPGGGS